MIKKQFTLYLENKPGALEKVTRLLGKEKINIEADENTLVISGSTEKEEEEKGESWYRAERESGEFRRAFELPNGCDVENIDANAKHGSLMIVIPKKPEAQKKKVDIKVRDK